MVVSGRHDARRLLRCYLIGWWRMQISCYSSRWDSGSTSRTVRTKEIRITYILMEINWNVHCDRLLRSVFSWLKKRDDAPSRVYLAWVLADSYLLHTRCSQTDRTSQMTTVANDAGGRLQLRKSYICDIKRNKCKVQRLASDMYGPYLSFYCTRSAL